MSWALAIGSEWELQRGASIMKANCRTPNITSCIVHNYQMLQKSLSSGPHLLFLFFFCFYDSSLFSVLLKQLLFIRSITTTHHLFSFQFVACLPTHHFFVIARRRRLQKYSSCWRPKTLGYCLMICGSDSISLRRGSLIWMIRLSPKQYSLPDLNKYAMKWKFIRG